MFSFSVFFFFTDPATTDIYTLSLHDALPIFSLLTAVAATRALLGLLAGFRWFDNPRFMGAGGQQSATWLQIDFIDRKSTRLNSSHVAISYAVFCLKKKKNKNNK